MVKTKAPLLLGFVLFVSSCSAGGPLAGSRPEILELARGRLGRTVSLVRAGQSLLGVYSNWETTSLYVSQIPISGRLPSEAPPAQMIDKIDGTPPLAPSFGDHAIFARGDTVSILYLAREGEDHLVLKLASRDVGSPDWNLDVIDPPGIPVAVLPAGGDRLDLVWAAGSLLASPYPVSAPPLPLLSPFTPEGRASVLAGGGDTAEDKLAGADVGAALAGGATRGFTVYDAVSRALQLFRWNGTSYDRSTVDGAGPVHSSLFLEDGGLAVLSWDPQSHRLSLFRGGPGAASLARTTVSLSENTTAVALVEDNQRERSGIAGSADRSTTEAGEGRSRLLFLYDEGRRMGGGRVLHELSLLTPVSGQGEGRGRYRRTVLAAGDQPVADFSALQVSDSLYVLVLQESLKLIRFRLPR